jgi:hypothetical protein
LWRLQDMSGLQIAVNWISELERIIAAGGLR